MAETHYDVLCVTPSAPPSMITASFKALMKLHHPDVAREDSDVRAQAITAAYAVLGDETRRREYDAMLARDGGQQPKGADEPADGADLVLSPERDGILGDAIASSVAGTRIVLRPGVYRESLLLGKDIEIFGAGHGPGDVVIDSSETCLRIVDGHVRIDGVTLTSRGAPAESGTGALSIVLDENDDIVETAFESNDIGHAVSMTAGRLSASNCHFRSDSCAAVTIAGHQAYLVFDQCRVTDSPRSALVLRDRADGDLTDCEISSTATEGALLDVAGGAELRMRECRLLAGGDEGLRCTDSRVVVDGCEIPERAGTALSATGLTSSLSMTKCTVAGAGADGSAVGVVVSAGAMADLADCTISDALRGIDVQASSGVTLQRCALSGNAVGLFCADGMLELDECEIGDCVRLGIGVTGPAARLLMRSCRVSGIADAESVIGIQIGDGAIFEASSSTIQRVASGLVVREAGDATLRDCSIEDSHEVGVLCVDARMFLDDCAIHEFATMGVKVTGGEAAAAMQNCRITNMDGRGGHAGAAVYDGAALTLQSCEIAATTHGVIFGSATVGTVTDCGITDTSDAGIAIDTSASPTISGSRIHDCDGDGLWSAGLGTVHDCQIYRCRGSGVSLVHEATTSINDCVVRQNRGCGVLSQDSRPRVLNCNLTGNRDWAYQAAGSIKGSEGNRVVYLDDPTGGDPYLSGVQHEQRATNVYFTDLPQLQYLLGGFYQEHMYQWIKESEDTSPDGLRFTLLYRRTLTQNVEIKPKRGWARGSAGFRAGMLGGDIRTVIPVEYRLACAFTLEWNGTNWVNLSMRATEDIDPYNRAEYSLGHHHLAPSQLWTRGSVGAELDPFLITRLAA